MNHIVLLGDSISIAVRSIALEDTLMDRLGASGYVRSPLMIHNGYCHLRFPHSWCKVAL